jgi:3-phenylpropionate/trans-cinnamate dioxygenase ferredoxin subunit
MQDDYIEIAQVGELQPDEMKAFEIDGRRLLLVFAQGDYYVVDEMCTHEDYSLALGCIKDHRIKCSLHGSYFDLRSGEPDEEPADEPICSYAVKVEDGGIWVNPAQRRRKD